MSLAEALLALILPVLALVGNGAIAAVRKRFPAAAKALEKATPFAIVEADKARGVDLEVARALAGDVAAMAGGEGPVDRVALAVTAIRLEAALGRPVTAKAPSIHVAAGTIVALWLVGSAFLGGMLSGCGAAQLEHVAQVSGEIIARAEPCLVAQYAIEQDRCLEEHAEAARACVEDVRERWRPVISALVELRTVRCELEPAKCSDTK